MKKSSVEVAIRIRPMRQELSEEKPSWEVHRNSIIEKSNADSNFTFDKIYNTNSTTEEIYKSSVKDAIVKNVIGGYNGTVFAYGQTGSGKSFTMLGTGREDRQGVVPMAVHDLFAGVQKERAKGMQVHVQVAMLEIYNEHLRDLLCPSENVSLPLSIRENEHGVYVHNAIRRTVTTPEQCLSAIQDEAEVRRVCASTSMNSQSSRSHCLIRLLVEKTVSFDADSDDSSEGEESASPSGETLKKKIVSSLNLVDLAGSERVSKTGATGQRMVEGGHINKSLSCLTNVINALTEQHKGNTKVKYINYRDSKLTYLLKTALGGNSFTSVFCCMTPAEQHTDESRSTLQFASRAKTIRNEVLLNEVADTKTKMREMELEIRKLKRTVLASYIYEFSKDIKIKHLMEGGGGGGAGAGGGAAGAGGINAAELEQMETLLQELTDQNNDLRATVEEQQQQQQHVDPMLGLADDEEKANLRAENERLQITVTELQNDNKTITESLEELEELAEELEKENDAKDKDFSDEKKKNKALEQTIQSLQHQITCMEQQVVQMHEQRRLEEQNLLQRARGDELMEKLTTLHLEQQKLQFEHSTLLDMFSRAEIEKAQDVARLQDRIDELLNECDGQRNANMNMTSYVWRLISVANLVTRGKSLDPSEAHGPVRDHQVDQAIKALTAFVASRAARPPSVVTPSKVMDKETGEETIVAVKGIDSAAAAAAAAKTAADSSQEPQLSSASHTNEEQLRKRIKELENILVTKDAQRDVIVDTKLKRMQELALRLHTTSTQQRNEIKAALAENQRLHEIIRSDGRLSKLAKREDHQPLEEMDIMHRVTYAQPPSYPHGHN